MGRILKDEKEDGEYSCVEPLLEDCSDTRAFEFVDYPQVGGMGDLVKEESSDLTVKVEDDDEDEEEELAAEDPPVTEGAEPEAGFTRWRLRRPQKPRRFPSRRWPRVGLPPGT